MPNLAWWYTPKSGGYFQIATVTAAGGETSLTFSSIPATYTDLQIRGVFRDTYVASARVSNVFVQFNADTGTNYAYHNLTGDGTSVSAPGSAATNKISMEGAGLSDLSTASIFGASIIDIADYANTSKNKTVKFLAGDENNTASTNFEISLGSGLWLNTAAITSVVLKPQLTAFKANSTFTLYGIKAFA
jgi:hypothetical protein